jgi:hypothetical protein
MRWMPSRTFDVGETDAASAQALLEYAILFRP